MCAPGRPPAAEKSRSYCNISAKSVSKSSMTDDRTLVSGVLRGEEAASRCLIRKYERLVAHMVGRLVKQDEDREEICQDVFLRVFQRLAEFSFQSKLSTWIATVAYRHAINHLRKRRMKFVEIPEGADNAERLVVREDPLEILAVKDEEEQVLIFVEELPAHYKAVLTLYHLDGMSYAEIGEVMGMPDGTVKNYLFRARAMLKEKVIQYFQREIA